MLRAAVAQLHRATASPYGLRWAGVASTSGRPDGGADRSPLAPSDPPPPTSRHAALVADLQRTLTIRGLARAVRKHAAGWQLEDGEGWREREGETRGCIRARPRGGATRALAGEAGPTFPLLLTDSSLLLPSLIRRRPLGPRRLPRRPP